MAVLFIVYMPNEEDPPEDLETTENGDNNKVHTALPDIATANANSHYNGVGENGAAVSKIAIDIGEDDDSSLKKPLLRKTCSDSDDPDCTSSKSSDKRNDDKRVTRHQSLLAPDADKAVPRQSSENVLTKPEDMETGMRSVSDNVVYKGDKVRFQVTKLDSPEIERPKQPVAETTSSSVAEQVKETAAEDPDDDADVVVERITLKEVGD